MMTPPPKPKKQVQTKTKPEIDMPTVERRYAVGEAIEQMQAPSPDQKRDVTWGEYVLEGGLLAVLAVGLVWVTVAESTALRSLSPWVEQVGRLGVGLGLVVGYLWGRRTLRRWLTPTTDREVVRYVYKPAIEAAVAEDEITDAAEIRTHRRALQTYFFLFGFGLFLVGVVAVYPALLNASLALIVENSVTGSIIKLICGLLAIGVYLSLRSVVVMHREYDRLQAAHYHAQRLRPAAPLAELWARVTPTATTSVLREKLTALARIHHIKGHIDPSDLDTQGFTHSHLVTTIPNYLTSIMPILGLIGTIIGLTHSIGGFESVLSSSIDNKAQFASSVGSSIEGIGTAFYTTLAGTFSMLVMKFLNLVTRTAYRNYLVDMRNFILVEIVPRLHQQPVSTAIKPRKA